MFFSADDEDQDFLAPSGGSKLGSLFGGESGRGGGGNESLTYTAPKQPKKAEPNTQSSGSPQLLFATAVQAYKYVDNKYTSQGKLGVAILVDHANQDYRVLLYVSKSQQVTNARITSTFSYTVQPNNYGSFYDDQRQTWSLMFDSEANATQFAKNIAISKANSAGSALNSLISQDLQLGDGGALEMGDMVEVKYTGWLLTNHAFGQEFDSNVKADKLFRFKIGKGKVIKGWDTGVVGMKKGSKRLLVVPSSLGYGSQGAGSKIPPNSTLVFEIEVVRVKLSKSSESPSPSPSVNSEVVPQNTTPTPTEELEDGQSIKGRTKSLTEHMSQSGSGSTSNKAKLISRMARMGQPMLPLVGAVPAQPDSDEEQAMVSPQPVTDTPVQPSQPLGGPHLTKPVPHHPRPSAMQPVIQTTVQPAQVVQQQPAFLQNIPAAQQLSLYQSPQQQLQHQGLLQQQQMQNGFQPASGFQGQPQQYPNTMQQQPMYPGMGMAPTMPTMNSTSEATMPVLLTETRQQSTELRLSVGKVQDKVDQLLEKMDSLQKNGPLALQSSLPTMESSVLMHNIQRIVQENERLKKETYEKSAKIEKQNEKISELLQSNQSYVEKSQNLLEQRNEGFITSASQSQAKVLALEQEKVQLATELSTTTAQLSNAQLELASLRKKEFEAQQKLGNSNQDYKRNQEELQAMKSQHQEDEEKITELNKNLKEERLKRKQLDSRLSQLQEELTDMKSTTETLEKNLSERKRKAAEERRKMEEEFEDSKIALEQEVQSLRDKLRKQKSTTDVAAAEQISQVEEELNREWKEKSDRLLNAAQEKHNRALQSLKEEKTEMEEKVAALENKIQALKTNSDSGDKKQRALQEQIEEMSVWKEKYDNLRTQASAMKEKYEDRISDLESERDELDAEKDKLQEKIEVLQKEVINKSETGGSSGADVAGEVKKIMNSVYQQLRSEFETEQSYKGTQILSAILSVIKLTTLKLVQQSSSSKENESEDDDEEDEDEEESEEEEEDEKISDSEDQDDYAKEPEPSQVEKQNSPEKENSEIKEEIPVQEEEKTQQSSVIEIPVQPKEEEKTQQNSAIEVKEGYSEAEVASLDLESGVPTVVKSDTVPEVPNAEETSTDNVPSPSETVLGQDETRTSDQSQTTPKQTDSSPQKQNKFDDFEIPSIVSREPPPMLDDSGSTESEQEKPDDSPLFGEDDNIADTFGETFNSTEKQEDKKKKSETKDLMNDDDLKPAPPPPLFPDDDDEDDLDWLS